MNAQICWAKLGSIRWKRPKPNFARCCTGRRARIKALLLDQHVLGGMGNIYTDESLVARADSIPSGWAQI